MIVYLAGPIDALGSTDGKTWNVCAQTYIRNSGHSAYSPLMAWAADVGDAISVCSINRAAICYSDGMFVNLTMNVPVFETIREIEFFKSRNSKKPVLVWVPKVSEANYYSKLGCHDLVISSADTIENAIDELFDNMEMKNAKGA